MGGIPWKCGRSPPGRVPAYFVDGKNLHKIETLAAAADIFGLKGEDLEAVLLRKTFKAAVDQDWLRAHEPGIPAVPTFRMRRENLVGAQPYERWAAFLTSKGAPARKL